MAGLDPWVGNFVSRRMAGRVASGRGVSLLGRAGNSGEDAPFSFFSEKALVIGEMLCLRFLPVFFPLERGWRGWLG